MKRLSFLLLVAILFCGCENMGSTEYGLRFWKLPPQFGGGVASKIYHPGEIAFHIPIVSELYRFDTAVKDISWGDSTQGEDHVRSGYVQTRALDGNEVALAVTVSYKVSTEPESLRRLLQDVALTNKGVEDIVLAAARADIRTFMNELRTKEFISKEPRYRAVDKVRENMKKRLENYGIEIVRVNLDDFMFRRLRGDGSFDSSYDERLKDIQEKREETEREKARIDTVSAKKEQELKNMQALVNQQVEEAKGFKIQSQARGDAYLKAKDNEARAILAQGRAEVEGLLEQINALRGPGGEAILKLEIARQLLKNDPKFVLFGNNAASSEIGVTRIDSNELISQLGLLEGVKDSKSMGKTEVPAQPVISELGKGEK